MEVIILGLIFTVIGGLMLAYGREEMSIMFGVIMGVIGIVVLSASLCSYTIAYHKAKFINERYGLSYTTYEFFWNGDLIMGELKSNDKYTDTNSRIQIKLTK